jgi:VanZ family protein
MRKALLVFFALGVAAAIFYLSSIPGGKIHAPFPYFDKVAHFTVFGLFAFFVYGVMSEFGFKKKLLLIVVIIGSIYGASDEIHQLFVQGRDCSIFDWIADFCGVAGIAFITSKIGLFKSKPTLKMN